MNLVIQFEKWDQLIQLGQGAKVRRLLQDLPISKLPRDQILTFCSLARRVNLNYLALRAIQPIVRPEKILVKEATAKEWSIYAALLIKVGAIEEALEILSTLKSSEVNEAPLYTSYAYMGHWNYKSAISPLKRYIKSEKITPYQKAIGQLNLAACYTALGDLETSKPILKDLMEAALKNSWNLIYGHVLEVGAQLSIQAEDWERAISQLEESQIRLKDIKSQFYFFTEKWMAFLKLKKEGPHPVNLKNIERIRNEAKSRDYWESVRECDLNLAIAQRNFHLLCRVYFCTPFREYKKRILQLWGGNEKLPNEFILQLNEPRDVGPVFDLLKGHEINRTSEFILKPGQNLYRLMSVLLSDFYKPHLIGALHAKLFPDEYFNPVSSPLRVFQNVTRLRVMLKENAIPLDVILYKGQYRLTATGPYSFKIPQKRIINNKDIKSELSIDQLKRIWTYKAFSAQQACSELNCSIRSINYLLKKAVEEKKLFKVGRGRGTFYKFKK